MIQLIYILVTVALVTLILLQQRSAGMSGLFGGGESGGFYQARRGMERFFFGSTIVLGVIFVALSLWQLLHR